VGSDPRIRSRHGWRSRGALKHWPIGKVANQGARPKVPGDCPIALATLVTGCWRLAATKRLTTEVALLWADASGESRATRKNLYLAPGGYPAVHAVFDDVQRMN
jgi:hypothetical protein